VLALAQNPATFVFGWVLGGVAMAATLYDPAFATPPPLSREHYRRTSRRDPDRRFASTGVGH